MDEGNVRVLFYSHDSQGLGHVRRNWVLAHQVARHLAEQGLGVSGLLVSGLVGAQRLPLPPGFDWVILPRVGKGSDGYRASSLGESVETLVRLRSKILRATLAAYEPDLVVIDRHAYGVRGELRRALVKLRRRKPDARIVLGLREVLDMPEVTTREWERLKSPLRVRNLFDEVWVYGDPDVHDAVASGEVPAMLADRVRFTGYLAHDRTGEVSAGALAQAGGRPYVITTAGGGSDGHTLLRAAVAMTPPPGHVHVVVAGPQGADDHLEELSEAAGPDTIVLRRLPGIADHVASASAVISMGGYNTVCEVLATNTPALIVPREHPRREQLIRARSLDAVGAVDLLRHHDLSSDALAAWTAAAVTRTVDRGHLDRDGLAAAGRYASELLADVADTAQVVGA